MSKRQAARRSDPPRRLILGIDPGVALVGYALVAEQQGGRLECLACDVIATPARMPLQHRLQLIYRGVSRLILTYHPQEAAMESLFFGHNRTTGMAVGHARGVIMLALADGGLTIAEYTPSQVKQAVTGHGGAKKQQVGEMVRILLGLSSPPRPDDAADAAAVAICHAHTSHIRLLLKSQEGPLVPVR
jgi:crossover junction endodeoxyribonuclease RuvC